VAIIKSKAAAKNCSFNDEIVYFLADNIESNIRELEGALNTVICQFQVKKQTLSLNDVKPLIKNSKPQKNISFKDLAKLVAEFYHIEEKSIYEKTRKKEVVKPRQVVMYLLREDFGVSFPSIGEKLGGRDHTTVIHSCEKIKDDLKKDNILTREINQIRSLL
jgi:chromosomal replication initiator protein